MDTYYKRCGSYMCLTHTIGTHSVLLPIQGPPLTNISPGRIPLHVYSS